MDINSAYILTQLIFNKNQNGNITPDDWNNAAVISQISIINDLLGNEQTYQEGFRGGQNHPVPRYGLGTTQKIMEDLRPIITRFDTTLSGDRTSSYPSDSLYLFSVHEFNGTTDGAEIIPVQPDEAHYLQQSVIKPPILGKGIYYVIGDLIYFKPITLTGISITYVMRPANPHWGYSYVSGVPTYDSGSSQNFKLGELVHLRIVQRMLQFFGLNLSLDNITQAALVMEQQGQ